MVRWDVFENLILCGVCVCVEDLIRCVVCLWFFYVVSSRFDVGVWFVVSWDW